MNCKELGYKVGDKFEVIKEQASCFDVGTVVRLYDDDGSEMPMFKDGEGRKRWIFLSNLKKIEPGKTLLEILVDELPKHGGWPEGVDRLVQDPDKEIQHLSNRNVYLCSVGWVGGGRDDFRGDYIRGINVLAIDYKTAIITRDQYESALAEKNDGWIKWDGGECPVDGDTMVVIKLRNGEVWHDGETVRADSVDWGNDDCCLDVVSYRLSKPEDVEQVDDSGVVAAGCSTDFSTTIESLTDAIIEYGCEANLAYPLAKHLLSKGLFK